MNWKLIFGLSLLGLAMALATISLVPQKVEPFLWLAIFIFSAYVIAQQGTGKYFLHGFLVSLVNCVWITGAHVLFYSTYIAHHPDMVEMNAKMPAAIANHPRLAMLITGPIVGVVCGLILGLFAFVASKLVKKPTVVAGAS
ncbi:MAG TPA: hypothetical protein VGM41_21175 [Chitinophagaceae bacterium]|jgi:uncharacterized membrane protein